jgi:hypothetical protein
MSKAMIGPDEDQWLFKLEVLAAIRPAVTRNQALLALVNAGLASPEGRSIVDRVFPASYDGDAVMTGASPATVFQAVQALQAAEPLLRELTASFPEDRFRPEQVSDALRRTRAAILALAGNARWSPPI